MLLGYGFTLEEATMPKSLPALCLTLRASSLEIVGLVVHAGVFLSLPEIQTLTFLILCFQNENPGAARI